MDFTFLKGSNVAFFRSDAQEAEWTEEELSLHCTFPYDPGKEIQRGMVVLFQDPATNSWQAYEIRQCVLYPGGFYQQFTAEDLAVSELTDCHIPEKKEYTDISAADALRDLLTGTGWQVGTTVNSVSSGDINRGSVWSNIQTIVSNWNVYIVPRVTVGQDGITGRFLDIVSSSGFDRGLRLAINKNVTDPCVTYDDSDLYTALYGYGGSYTDTDKETKEYTFTDVVWSKTSAHPAKPRCQKYIEYPEMTALYGRNGKPRFGYYQNTEIKDPNVLLQKTWESLKQCCEPKISISGTVTDLYRMGYKDQPLRLHDLAIIELEPVGILVYKQIIKLTVNLLDPTKNLPEIGDYIPNIIYINRETGEKARGGGGGGGGRGPSDKIDVDLDNIVVKAYDTGQTIGMFGHILDEHGEIISKAGLHIDPKTGVLIYDTTSDEMLGSMFHVQQEQITLEVFDRKQADKQMEASIKVNKEQIELKVSKNGVISAINQTAESIKISANKIELDGNTVAKSLYGEDVQIGVLNCSEAFMADVSADGDIECTGKLYGQTLGVGAHDASWKSVTITNITGLTNSHSFIYGSTTDPQGIATGRLVAATADVTLHYLGY